MPRLSVPLTADQHAAIRRKAGVLGVPQAEVARRLLLAWVDGKIEMPISSNKIPTKAKCASCGFDLDTYGSSGSALVYAVGDKLPCPVCGRQMEWIKGIIEETP